MPSRAARPTTATASRTCSSRRWRPARRSSRARVSGIPELVEHEVNGLLVAPEDPEALADALLRLHGDPALRGAARAARRARPSRGRFDGARLAGRLAELFREALRMTSAVAPPAPGAVRDRARAPQPRGRRRRARRALHGRGRDARARAPTPTGSARDLPADEEWRIEWVKFGWGLDLAHAAAETGDRALPRRLGAADRVVDRAGRRRTHDAAEVTAPADPQLDLRLAAARRRRRRTPSGCSRASPRRSRTSAPTSRPRATTARSSCTRCSSPRSRCPSSTATACSSFAVAELDRNLATDFRPDGVHREASTHYHADRAALVRRRARERPPLRGRAAGRLRRRGSPARARSPRTARRPDGTIPALSDADTGDYARCWRWPRELLGDDELRYVGSRGRAGARPRYAPELPRRRLPRPAQRLGPRRAAS